MGARIDIEAARSIRRKYTHPHSRGSCCPLYDELLRAKCSTPLALYRSPVASTGHARNTTGTPTPIDHRCSTHLFRRRSPHPSAMRFFFASRDKLWPGGAQSCNTRKGKAAGGPTTVLKHPAISQQGESQRIRRNPSMPARKKRIPAKTARRMRTVHTRSVMHLFPRVPATAYFQC